MLITTISISGIELFGNKQLQFDNLTNFTTLIGSNNSGKSTILNMFSLVSGGGDLHEKFHFSTHEPIRINWTFNASLDELHKDPNALTAKLSFLKPELLAYLRENGITYILESTIKTDAGAITESKFRGTFLRDGHLFKEDNFSNRQAPDSSVQNFFSDYFKNYRKEMQRPHKLTNWGLISFVNLKRESQRHGLMQQLRDSDYSVKYDNFVERFSNFFQTFPKIKHTAQAVFSIIGAREDNSELRIPFNFEGSGCMRAFQILNEIFLLEEGLNDIQNVQKITPILFIDEPELSMHAELQRKIFHELKDFSKKGQVFIATHSPIFVSPGKSRTIILLPPVRTDKEIKLITKPVLNEISGALGLRNRDYFLYNFVLCVEGYTEEEFLFKLLDEFNIDPYDYSIWIRNLKGVDTIREPFTTNVYDLLLNIGMEVSIVTDKEGKYKSSKRQLESKFAEQVENKQFQWHLWSTTNFEANFSPEALHETLEMCVKEFGKSINMKLDEFKQSLLERNEDQYPNMIREIYHASTNATLDKKQFGRCLAAVILTALDEYKKNEVVQFFVNYFSKHNIQLLT